MQLILAMAQFHCRIRQNPDCYNFHLPFSLAKKDSYSLSFESILALRQLPTKPILGVDLFVNSHGKNKKKSHQVLYVNSRQAQRQLLVPAFSHMERSDVKQP